MAFPRLSGTSVWRISERCSLDPAGVGEVVVLGGEGPRARREGSSRPLGPPGQRDPSEGPEEAVSWVISFCLRCLGHHGAVGWGGSLRPKHTLEKEFMGT